MNFLPCWIYDQMTDPRTRTSLRRAFVVAAVSVGYMIAVGNALAQSPPMPPGLTAIDGEPYGLSHDFTGLPLDEDGWTDFQALIASGYEDARVVFVSSSLGDDTSAGVYGVSDLAFDDKGLFQAPATVKPFKTIAAANARMRSGYPDILLLKRGDRWVGEGWSVGSIGRAPAGRSKTERHIIAAYGSGERPRLQNDSGISFDNDDTSYIVVSSLDFFATDWRVSGRAIDVRGTSTDVLFEDVRVTNQINIIQGGALDNIVIRRSAFSGGQAHDGQFYAAKATHLLFEENIFYKPFQKSYPDESVHGRIFYLNPGDGLNLHGLDVTLRGNILYHAERGGIDGRAGGLFDNNLFVGASVRFGAGGGSSGSTVSGAVTNSVFTQSTPNLLGATGLTVVNGVDVSVSGNIFTDARNPSSEVNAILIAGNTDTRYADIGPTRVTRNVEVRENIIYQYSGSNAHNRAIWISSTLNGQPEEYVDHILVGNNQVQAPDNSWILVASSDLPLSRGTWSDNRYFKNSSRNQFLQGTFDDWVAASGETTAAFEQHNYPDPKRTIDSYHHSLGGEASTGAFMLRALNNSRHNWEPALTAPRVNEYIRGGFGR